jgi:hypothetical protein
MVTSSRSTERGEDSSEAFGSKSKGRKGKGKCWFCGVTRKISLRQGANHNRQNDTQKSTLISSMLYKGNANKRRLGAYLVWMFEEDHR